MDFDTFSRRAHEAFSTIPSEFREGVDGLTIRPERAPHPALPDIYTLGQCLTEGYPSDWSGPETVRSVLVLFFGSFQALAAQTPGFDWDEELWETLTHELRHHLESLADEDALEGVDYAMEESFRRAKGENFDPFYYQAGLEVAPGLFQVEYDLFLEKPWSENDRASEPHLVFSWHGSAYRVAWPETLGDVHYLWIRGLEVGAGALQLVLVRRRGLKERLRRARSALDLWESEAVAEKL